LSNFLLLLEDDDADACGGDDGSGECMYVLYVTPQKIKEREREREREREGR
jgi:hypothetical protein